MVSGSNIGLHQNRGLCLNLSWVNVAKQKGYTFFQLNIVSLARDAVPLTTAPISIPNTCYDETLSIDASAICCP